MRQGGPSMAAIDGPAGPSMATKSAVDGPDGPVVAGDHLQYDRLSMMARGRVFQSLIVTGFEKSRLRRTKMKIDF